MNWRNRKIRIAIVLAIAVVAAVVAWRTGGVIGKSAAPCVEERKEEKDSAGNVIKITRKQCFE